jgi:UDP-glucose 4-epimerase
MKNLFLVTGGAGFIGSHLATRLAAQGHRVRVFDNFSTGSRLNLPAATSNFQVIWGDIRDINALVRAATGVAVIFHQAARGSVPRSLEDPVGTNDTNVTGTLNVFEAARRAGVRRVVYASSSSVYGESLELPQREDHRPAPISPYAGSKLAGEQYARVWYRAYGLDTVGLRYFNVFGPRQDPGSTYAAVIPRFIAWALRGEPLEIHGRGQQSRDFTYVDNVVEANILAANAADVSGEVFNVSGGASVSLLDVVALLEAMLGRPLERRHTPPREADVPQSLADLSKSRRLLDYQPRVGFAEGLLRTLEAFRSAGRPMVNVDA